jgi:hypothetical protein
VTYKAYEAVYVAIILLRYICREINHFNYTILSAERCAVELRSGKLLDAYCRDLECKLATPTYLSSRHDKERR